MPQDPKSKADWAKQLFFLREYRAFSRKMLSKRGDDWFNDAYLIYKQICHNNPDFENAPFPQGIDRYRFPGVRVSVKTDFWAERPGPTIDKLMRKIIVAWENYKDEKYAKFTGTRGKRVETPEEETKTEQPPDNQSDSQVPVQEPSGEVGCLPQGNQPGQGTPSGGAS